MKSNRLLRTTFAASFIAAGLVLSGCEIVEDAVDPDCTPDKAAQNLATQATVGLPSNRCSPAETVRDVAGVDG